MEQVGAYSRQPWALSEPTISHQLATWRHSRWTAIGVVCPLHLHCSALLDHCLILLYHCYSSSQPTCRLLRHPRPRWTSHGSTRRHPRQERGTEPGTRRTMVGIKMNTSTPNNNRTYPVLISTRPRRRPCLQNHRISLTQKQSPMPRWNHPSRPVAVVVHEVVAVKIKARII